ncbi:MAG: 1,4-alpha-glucan branching protein GlgB [Butyrivibrio sp.]|nr:1,4-alpha-glucan branching protein GlgB [Butyrivibrio sp.]
MNKKLYELMNWPEIEGIVYSDVAHPKKLLGQHAVKGGQLIQSFHPGAVNAYVVERGGSRHKMEQVDEEGFFAVLIPGKNPVDYTLLYEFEDKSVFETEDIYNYPSMLDEKLLKAFSAGNNGKAYELLGAHITKVGGVKGVLFVLWAPNALRVSVVGDFNAWDGRKHQMELNGDSGVFELFIPGIEEGAVYKYELRIKGGAVVLKADPYAFAAELRPDTASVVYNPKTYKWNDKEWMQERDKDKYKTKPMSVYELHAGSFKTPDDEREFLNYRELAPAVIEYVTEMGYTHVELMPVMEHPFDGSWGYQVTGYYAPTARYGTPDDFKFFMDELHKAGIGVILDWVPAHFPKDAFGLAKFDGTCLYEHFDKRQGEHPDWGTLIYNFGRPEVADFLISNAVFWAKEYHADGIRMDAVASMLYLDYGKRDGGWVANMYGGNENLEAVDFLKKLSKTFAKQCKNAMLIAEESTAWPQVTGDADNGSLGFDYKWNMGWMNDFLDFMSCDPLFRKGRYNELTFSMIYAYSEDFILTLSHDEVVHGKCSMLNKMPGATKKEKLANLRAAYGFMFTHPGKKLLFMGQDFGMENEWWEARQIDWELTKLEENRQLMDYVADLNRLYRTEPALHKLDYTPDGFEWINNISADECIVVYVRKTSDSDMLLVVANFTPVQRDKYKVGVPHMGKYKEIFNSEDEKYGGSGAVNKRVIPSKKDECDGREDSIRLTVPPMGVTILRYTEADTTPKKREASAAKTAAESKTAKGKTGRKPGNTSKKANK